MFLFYIFYYYLLWLFHRADSHCVLKANELNGNPSSSTWKTLDGKPPVLIAHRGEKVLVPEHTLAGYKLAAILGADYVEPDLCLTKDEHLVCHHDIFLTEDTTDVGDHPEFLHLRRNSSDDGKYKWYIQEFTLEELKRLRVKQKRTGVRPQDFNGIFSIPTFQEFIQVIHELNYKMNKSVGIAPELKTPHTFNAYRSPHFIEKKLLSKLREYGYAVGQNDTENCVAGQNNRIPCPPIVIQSFEFPTIEYLSNLTKIDLVMLVWDDPQFLTRKGIQKIAKVAQYYSIWKEFVFTGTESFLRHANKRQVDDLEGQTNIEEDGGFIPPHEFAQFVHKQGLKLVIYTVYDSREPSYLLGIERNNDTVDSKKVEMQKYFDVGVDGIFVENVAESRAILREAVSNLMFNSLRQSSLASSLQLNSVWHMISIAICLFITY